MKLESAYHLKEELLLGIAERARVRGNKALPAIALGIAPPTRKREFRIAVRPRSRRDLAGLHEYIDDRTAGEMEIRVTGAILAAAGAVALGLGASISRAEGRCRTGSLGFFARRNGDGSLGFVSNNHILAAEDAGRDGDLIVFPGKADRHLADPTGIARLDGNYPRLQVGGARVDCAFALFFDETDVMQPSFGKPVVAMSNLAVTKNGRSTGQTHGCVSAFSLDRCRVDYAFGFTTFQGQIEIESLDARPFASGGDSGSLILTEDGHPVGLLHSVSAAGGRINNSGLTFANPIQPVLDALDVSFLS